MFVSLELSEILDVVIEWHAKTRLGLVARDFVITAMFCCTSQLERIVISFDISIVISDSTLKKPLVH
jgi:hypothetical protein